MGFPEDKTVILESDGDIDEAKILYCITVAAYVVGSHQLILGTKKITIGGSGIVDMEDTIDGGALAREKGAVTFASLYDYVETRDESKLVYLTKGMKVS